MSNISSSSIVAFPAANRGTSFATGRRTTEKNITNFVNLGNEEASFVITNNYSASSPFEFVICGYYFNVTAGALPVTAGQPLYARIVLKTYEGTDFQELYPTVEGSSDAALDNNSNQFLGVDFSTSSSGSGYVLQLLDSNGVIPRASQHRASSVSVYLDDGDLDTL